MSNPSMLLFDLADVEPYLIRVVTNDKSEDGLKPICLEWEQIPCDSWRPSDHFHGHDEF